MMRAIKVVSRSDFEHEKTFEREFEGIKFFEPISRGHPGLVDILHVGRNDEDQFYYYVMELADDQISGPVIVPDQYVPKNLSNEISNQGRISLKDCCDWGSVMADALDHIHDAGLAHRACCRCCRCCRGCRCWRERKTATEANAGTSRRAERS